MRRLHQVRRVNAGRAGRWVWLLAGVMLADGQAGRAAGQWHWQNPLPQGNWLYGIWCSGPSNVSVVGVYGTILHYVPGDINADGHVDVADMLILAASFGRTAGQPGFNSACDLNKDTKVDVSEVLILAHDWGT